jgi:hypothetical protein
VISSFSSSHLGFSLVLRLFSDLVGADLALLALLGGGEGPAMVNCCLESLPSHREPHAHAH